VTAKDTVLGVPVQLLARPEHVERIRVGHGRGRLQAAQRGFAQALALVKPVLVNSCGEGAQPTDVMNAEALQLANVAAMARVG